MKPTPLENWIIRRTGIPERSRELLEKYQLERIRETVRYAASHSRFYKEHLNTIDADTIRSMEDVQALPFTFPQQISNCSPDFLCVPQSVVKRIVTLKTSGTSGTEKRIYFAEEDLNLTVDFFQWGMRCLTDSTDRILVLLPGNSYGSIGDLLKKALSEMKIQCFVCGVMSDTVETARFIEENSITCIVGIPIQIMQLARTEHEAFIRIKKVLLSTDYVPEALISELSEYGCKVFTHYGMTEMGYGGGVECEALNGYHMREADLYFEIVDPVTARPVPDGQWGEVVFTTLTRKAMPLIRYRTGDIAAFSPLPCLCGTFLKTMKRVRGRFANQVKIGENKFLALAELDELILPFREVMDYHVRLSAENRIDIEIAAIDKGLCCDEIRCRVMKYIHGKFGCKINPSIRISRSSESPKIRNSMIKRAFGNLKADKIEPQNAE